MKTKDCSEVGRKKGEEGFTLIELILVIALGAMIMLTAMILYNKSRDAAVTDTNVKSVHTIMAGLSELRLYKGKLSAGSSWPADTAAYVDSSLTASYGYNCSSGVLTITTQKADNPAQAGRILTKLQDQNLCDSGSAINGSDATRVDCIITSFNGSSGC
ncbi:MAG: type II secretion system protein [Nitrospiraceae bacterium]|nr:type II secretion system protein [Nitrospiraceae bacterium]